MRITFVASEGVPFSKTGGLADVVGALPKALVACGQEVKVFLPRHRQTKPGPLVPELAHVTMPLGYSFGAASVERGDDLHYLVECPQFFDRVGLYQEDGLDYPDNIERFAGFSLACLEAMKRLPQPPDVIHVHDWQAAALPIYVRTLYRNDPFFRNTSVMLTIHNLAFQGLFPPSLMPKISIDPALFTIDALEFYGKANLLKGAIIFSDFITTVSRKYAEEIQTPEFGAGLDGVLRTRAQYIQGILNGVDYTEWNPETDKFIAANYSPADLKGKRVCKKALLEKMGVANPVLERPVIGIVSRFATQKGFDLIAEILEPLMAMDVYIVALGTGEPEYEALFRSMAQRYPDRFLVKIAYDNELAHQIEAGADMFLMPSRYEPCGLNQIYSLKYGTVPVVRATGGLDDTIEPVEGDKGTGFKISEYSGFALMEALRRAIILYRDPRAWRKVMLNGMAKDFSWASSAGQYAQLYARLRRSKLESKPGSGASNL